MGKQKEVDRTTRLLITLSFLGGSWFLLRGVTNFWMKTFSEIAYSKSLINYEHLISMWSLIIMVVITGTIIRYLYFEYKNYQYIPNDEERAISLGKADNAFKQIFDILKLLAKLSIYSIILILLMSCVTEINIKNLFLLIFIGIVLAIIYSWIIRPKLKINLINILPISIVKAQQIGLILYLLILVCIVSLSMIIISLEGNQEVSMNIFDTKKVPLEILLENYEKPIIKIKIVRETKPANNVEIKLDEKNLQESVIEVYESRLSKGNFILRENESNNKKIKINKNKYYYKYDLSLERYLLQGQNLIEVYILNNGNMSKKTIHIVTSIYKDGEEINISSNSFKVSP